jgi:hypothetical protein
MLVIEAPVFWAFCRMQGLSLSDPDAPAQSSPARGLTTPLSDRVVGPFARRAPSG